MSNPTEPNETVMQRWVDCMNTMARAAHAGGFSGEDAKAAALIYFTCAVIMNGTTEQEASLAVISAYQFFKQHPRYAVVDINATVMGGNEKVH